MQPLVSVIIPLYNVEQYIGECLESVVRQSYKNLEILIVDDRGTDGSLALAEGFMTDARVRILHHEVNRGLGPARNTGLEAAGGKYVYFLDSDDWLSVRAIEELVDVAERTGADITYSTGVAFAEGTAPALIQQAVSTNTWLSRTAVAPGVYQLSLENTSIMPPVAWSKLYSKSFLERNAIRFVDARLIHEDEGFFQKCVANLPRIALTDKKSYHYRIRSNSLMVSTGKRGTNVSHLRQVLDDTFEYIRSRNLDPRFIAKIRDNYPAAFSRQIGPFHVFWGSDSKIVRFGRLALVRLQRKDGHGIFKLLGITLRRW